MRNNIINLFSDFEIVLESNYLPIELNSSLKQHIEDIWKQEVVRTKGRVFNGELLSGNNFDGKILKGNFVQYKYYLAQLRDPSLEKTLKIYPICVCGYTTLEDSILIGKRSGYVTDYPNFFELVPAGGIDLSALHEGRVDIYKQYYVELKEEANIEPKSVKKITPTSLITYPSSFSYEICAHIELNPSVKIDMEQRQDEYTELFWIHKNEIKEFMIKEKETINPLSFQIFELFNL